MLMLAGINAIASASCEYFMNAPVVVGCLACR